MKAWFVSDIHIAGPEDKRALRFEKFLLARLTDSTTHVFLVGDIFDLWVGGHAFFVNRYGGIIRAIRALRANSIEVIYFEGNHDLNIENFWSERADCQVFTGPGYFVLGPYRVRVEHGDQMNPSDTGYLLLRNVLRSKIIKWLSHELPGRFLQILGDRLSRTSRKWTSSNLKTKNFEDIRSIIHSHAQRVYETDEPFDFIFSGHLHVRDEFSWITSKGATAQSVNLGWWSIEAVPQVYCLTAIGGKWISL